MFLYHRLQQRVDNSKTDCVFSVTSLPCSIIANDDFSIAKQTPFSLIQQTVVSYDGFHCTVFSTVYRRLLRRVSNSVPSSPTTSFQQCTVVSYDEFSTVYRRLLRRVFNSVPSSPTTSFVPSFPTTSFQSVPSSPTTGFHSVPSSPTTSFQQCTVVSYDEFSTVYRRLPTTSFQQCTVVSLRRVSTVTVVSVVSLRNRPSSPTTSFQQCTVVSLTTCFLTAKPTPFSANFFLPVSDAPEADFF
ncbi:unnamed protein product [Acanthosepion pharaonis]|uniref:Uncharacterized protein n=1 Tax=Acanthosepion pharaonis TaxID=158019 RepID=A0A812DUI5_ACAPH|nr:unnamed protein product [Sepia pharaonis]